MLSESGYKHFPSVTIYGDQLNWPASGPINQWLQNRGWGFGMKHVT